MEFEDVGSDKERKLVVQFVEPSLKPLILNLTNGDSIAEIAGTDDYTKWPGTKIQLFASKTLFQGKRVPAIRLSAPQQPADITAGLTPTAQVF